MTLERLPGRQFPTTRRDGTKFVTPTVVGFVAPRDDEVVRVAVVASRAVGNAVRRNQAKRYLRAAVQDVTWTRAQDVVLHARARTAHAGMRAVASDLGRLPGVSA